MYKEGQHCGCSYRVNKNGDCFTQTGNKEWKHREWRYNADGYPVVSAVGWQQGKKIYRSLQVHILVAEQFVEGWFEGAEVNHKDFDRTNPKANNLEWITHGDNVRYSRSAGHYPDYAGESNPNFGNDTLHKKYKNNPELAKEKQSRPRAKNGRAKLCELTNMQSQEKFSFNCQRDAVDYLITHEHCDNVNKETVIKYLKRDNGYRGWKLFIL